MANPTRGAAQAAAAVRNALKSTGPRTDEGKSRSSLNRVRHGLSSANVLLPGEDPAHYEATLASWAETLSPTTRAEAEVVAQVADAAFRLERLSRLETGRTLALIEEELGRTDVATSIRATRAALTAVRALVQTVEACPEPPEHVALLEGLVDGVDGTLDLINAVPGLQSEAGLLLARAQGALVQGAWQVRREGYLELGRVAREVERTLGAKLAQEEGQLPALREQLAAQVVLLEDGDLKKLERHRRLLETSMMRLLDVLQKVRLAARAVPPSGADTPVEQVVKLRIVR